MLCHLNFCLQVFELVESKTETLCLQINAFLKLLSLCCACLHRVDVIWIMHMSHWEMSLHTYTRRWLCFWRSFTTQYMTYR